MTGHIVSADIGIYGPHAELSQSKAFARKSLLYGGSSYFRCSPQMLVTENDAFQKEIERVTSDRLSDLQVNPPSVVVTAPNAIIWHNQVFIEEDGNLKHLHEFQRPTDLRLWSPDVVRLARAMPHVIEIDKGYFVGTAGSQNYGHFIADDLGRLKGVENLGVVIFTSFGDSIDAVKTDVARSLGLVPRFIQPEIPARVHDFQYATPISIQPHIHNREAIKWVYDRFSCGTPTKRIFVPRLSGRRQIVNQEDLYPLLDKHGFETFDPASATFFQQVRAFSEAKIVLGVMGAGMGNTIFCQPGTNVGYISPEWWADVYYWELASACDHHYSVYFGRRTDPVKPSHEDDIVVDPKKFEGFLTRLLMI